MRSRAELDSIKSELGLDAYDLEGGDLAIHSPIDGAELASLKQNTAADIDRMVAQAGEAFIKWREVPAPARGELIRLFGLELRANKDSLGRLVTIENGKILAEGLGEVQEMIDICDFALGLSRQLYGLTIASERPGHHMREMWHPVGPVGVITAFNFPVAVWSWNTAVAIVCGDPVIWKPSEKTPLTALACAALFSRAIEACRKQGGDVPDNLLQMAIGGREVGESISHHPGLPLVSATGSVTMGRDVAKAVAGRLGRSILELGGNNGMIVSSAADLDMAVKAILFGAVGTAGQRCTTLRRLIVHADIKDSLLEPLVRAYKSIRIGNPLQPDILVGPLIDEQAYEAMQSTLEEARKAGGTVLCGGERVKAGDVSGGVYVTPAIVDMPAQEEIVRTETFAPILYVMSYTDFDDALTVHNAVPQGLSSCVFTMDMRESEKFLSTVGSDTGIANVNIGPSGAEIGGAFGGEKETGGGRESGSDAWKAYMRRQTQTINYSTEMPLAQGVSFDVE